MNTYDNAFIFESIYLIISFLISIVVFYVRVSFKKERSRNVLFFTSIPIMFFTLSYRNMVYARYLNYLVRHRIILLMNHL